MSIWKDKKILIAITGGIAAYKINFLVRLFKKQGAEVKVILTPASLDFVTPLTLATLSGNAVEWEFTAEKGEWHSHVEYGLWADYMLIAPLTANTLSNMADGHCENLVVATYLSAKCPVYVAPAMDLDMYQHPTTQTNLEKIKANGNKVVPVGEGELASGLVGPGRMAEPEDIMSFMENDIKKSLPLYGKKITISAGPTFEPIDPVRFIGNHSSGKMGFELAKVASNMGAEVHLVSGPSCEKIDGYSVVQTKVTTAFDMQNAMQNNYEYQDVVIMAAAVADYRPKEVAQEKIKKNADSISLELVKNPDILLGLGQEKQQQFLVGFALETHNELEHAQAKLKKKNLDMIVLNSLQDVGAGFGTETNRVTFITKDEEIVNFDLKSKTEVAKDILTFIAQKIS